MRTCSLDLVKGESGPKWSVQPESESGVAPRRPGSVARQSIPSQLFFQSVVVLPVGRWWPRWLGVRRVSPAGPAGSLPGLRERGGVWQK